MLITNLELGDVGTLAERLPAHRRMLGYRTSTGYWMLIGATPAMIPAQWLAPAGHAGGDAGARSAPRR